MSSSRRPGETKRHFSEEADLVKVVLTGTVTLDQVLNEVRNPPDITRWNKMLWNFLDADLSEVQLLDAAEIVAEVVQNPLVSKVSYKMAFVAHAGPDQMVLRLYNVLMEEKEAPGRSFNMFDTESAAMAWLFETDEATSDACKSA